MFSVRTVTCWPRGEQRVTGRDRLGPQSPIATGSQGDSCPRGSTDVHHSSGCRYLMPGTGNRRTLVIIFYIYRKNLIVSVYINRWQNFLL